MKSHPFNICTNRPNRDPHFGAGKLGMLARKNKTTARPPLLFSLHRFVAQSFWKDDET